MHIAALTAAHAPAYRALMLEAYAQAADAFTSTAEERASEPMAWWEKRIAAANGLSESFGAFVLSGGSGDTGGDAVGVVSGDVGSRGDGQGGRLVGTVALEYSAKPKTRHSALLLGMFVRPEARRLGTGAALVRIAVAAARARPGTRVVRLTVTEGNAPAIRLYESLGFVAWGTEPEAILTPNGLRGKVHMWLALG